MLTGNPKKDELIRYLVDHSEYFFNGLDFYPELKCLLPMKFLQYSKRIHDLTVYEDDTWVLSYPKCGTTWVQEMVWLIANDLDYKGAEVNLMSRFPFLEYGALFDSSSQLEEVVGNTVDAVEKMPQPRFIRSHLPLALLPVQISEKKPKMVYIMRDPKDTAVSFYFHYRLLLGYNGEVEKFFDAFREGCVQYGCYLHHIAPYWKLRHEPNVLFLTYEDMKMNLSSVIKRTAAFFDKTLTDEQVAELAEHLSFARMKANNAVNLRDTIDFFRSAQKRPGSVEPGTEFMRRGHVGDYKNYMRSHEVQEYNKWIAETTKSLGLDLDEDFPY